MNTIINAFDSANASSTQFRLTTLDWRVWFLGYGLGGCAGLGLFVGLWSLIVDNDISLGLVSLAASFAHGCLLVLFWVYRSTVIATLAARICYLIGALGMATVALVLTTGGSQVPGLAALHSLAFMNFIMAFTVPLLLQERLGRTKPCPLAVALFLCAKQSFAAAGF